MPDNQVLGPVLEDGAEPSPTLPRNGIAAYVTSGGAFLEVATGRDPAPVPREHVEELVEFVADRGRGKPPGPSLLAFLAENEAIQAVDLPRRSGYHTATRDHPFLDMAEGTDARVVDARIMAGYLGVGLYPAVYSDFPADKRTVLEDAMDLDIDQLRISQSHQLALMLSGTFGVRRHVAPYYDPETDYHQVELLMKSVPSGGARHPTECFIEVFRGPDMASGQYHYNARTNSLDRISPTIRESWRSDAASEREGDWVVGVILAARVERAMFRYRDPRSFRAILVDVGHADAQLGALAAFCNWRYESSLDVQLDYHPLQESSAAAELPCILTGLLEGFG